jgi:hypothetical protein
MNRTSGSFLLDQSRMASSNWKLVFVRGRIQSKTSAQQENRPRKWLTINSPDKNHAYSIVKNIQVPIPLFGRYV